VSELIPFKFENREIRVAEISNQTWVLVADIAQAIEHSNPRELVKVIDKDDVRKVYVIDSLGRKQKAWAANESGTYQALLSSNLPKAKPFRKWVTAEVLPSIRKTGQYKSQSTSQWLKAREEGKLARRIETDTIKSFIAYATKQGSLNANWYYTSITKGTYAALFILEKGGDWKNLRQHLATLQLNQLSVAEFVAQKYIAEGMRLHMFYKDIYRFAIAKVEEMAAIMGRQLPGEKSNIERLHN
jgi:prophage antirepressor-like protein